MKSAIPVTSDSQFKDLLIYVNGVKLRDTDILDLQINWGENGAKGQFKFVDSFNMIEGASMSYATLSISYTDSVQLKTIADFIITKIDVIRLHDNVINVTCRFESLPIFSLKSTYLSKTFTDKTALEIVHLILDMYNIPANFYAKDDRVIDYLVTPSNISFYDFLVGFAKRENFIFFEDRDGLKFYSRNLLNFNTIAAPSEPPFTIGNTLEFHFWNILEYNGAISNIGDVIETCTTKITKNSNTLKYTPDTISTETVYETQKVNNYMGIDDLILPDVVWVNGEKNIDQISSSEIIGLDKDYRDIINSNQDFKISVHGMNVSRLFTKVKVDIPRPKIIQQGGNDEMYSGDFIVTKVVDKLVNTQFIQFIYLKASDYGKGAR